ncbi:MAG: tRNA (N6-threonylcarbamoyladenosine(37)-N6)-methyltransferase TrmO [Desulfobacteraceae bacterium]|nr:tRNA (N6-threonylcarbamoyladenosine(37)-N6)-methyltransferase TrmO [Desulfobacteraceae bacterium]MBC2756367.1 tRNA (N6-threonylcarbamoyladenosine(37)-N6)-methyltransferase TrmO [Desulfobacteraceae bacterium]
MKIEMTPIGVFHTNEKNIPRHWSVSEVKGRIEINKIYENGLKDISVGQEIIVLFYFHKSQPFDPASLVQTPPHRKKAMGVFSICSPYRPNPIGLSVLTVLNVEANIITVNHADMIDGTPILDIKPYIEDKRECPSYVEE